MFIVAISVPFAMVGSSVCRRAGLPVQLMGGQRLDAQLARAPGEPSMNPSSRQRRELTSAQHLDIDETAFQRRHEYVTLVTDLDRARVLYVADTRLSAASPPEFFEPHTVRSVFERAPDVRDGVRRERVEPAHVRSSHLFGAHDIAASPDVIWRRGRRPAPGPGAK
jgi:hypothetical protein